jgi:hypothetical protein
MAKNRVLVSGRVAQTLPVGGVVGWAALSWFVLTRRGLGVRQIPWPPLFAVVAILACAGLLYAGLLYILFAPNADGLHRLSMLLYALVVLALGIVKRLTGWSRVRRGEQLTFSHGVSYLNLFGRRKDLANRWGDPLLGTAAGVSLCHHGFWELGIWLIFTAACVFKVEREAFFQERHQQLDIIDGQLESDLLQQNVLRRASSVSQQGTVVGLATGMDSALKRQIRKERRG